MRFDLIDIQDFVQQIVETFAVVIKVDIMIFDLHRNIIAGTGDTKCRVGRQFHTGSLTGRVLTDGQLLIARDPGISAECETCENFSNCNEYDSVIAYPIRIGSRIMGSFCLVATNDEQKNLILENEAYLVDFMDKLCGLIGSTINEKRIQNDLTTLIKRYDTVVNNVAEGIIGLDQNGCIIHLNGSAENLLCLKEEKVINQHISSVFPDMDIKYADHPVETEIAYSIGNRRKKLHFWANIVPIIGEDKALLGASISLRKLSDMQSFASRLMGNFSKYTFDDIKGESSALEQIKSKLRKVSRTNSTILIRGESGTGKELFAHAVHSASYRSSKAFVAINCSAIPDSLLESELFGYEEGAFTGAKKGGKPGKFELADGGTIFLDEIGDMPLHLQSKLLRVLETRTIERVGGHEQISVDVRIVAATNRDLEKMVEDHEFREDLYYRLGVIPIYLPPLRERKEDIVILIDFFLEKYGQILNRSTQVLDNECKNVLLNYSWPGNIRELQNTIEYAINMSDPDHLITIESLPNRIIMNSMNEYKSAGQNHSISALSDIQHNESGKLKDMEIEAILQALKMFGSSTEGKEMAAKYLGISIATLYRRLKELKRLHIKID